MHIEDTNGYTYVDPLTSEESDVYVGSDGKSVVEKIFRDVLKKYNKHIFPPSMTIYLKNNKKPHKMIKYEANMASFNKKPNTIDVKMGNIVQQIDIAGSSKPTIIERETIVVKKSKKTSSKKSKSKVKPSKPPDSEFPFFSNQTYDLDNIFSLLVTTDHIITIKEFGSHYSNVLFRFVSDPTTVVECINDYLDNSSLEVTKQGDIGIVLSGSKAIINFSFDDPTDRIHVEINIDKINQENFAELCAKINEKYPTKITGLIDK